MCAEVMPSLRILQFPGLFQNADEAKYVVNQFSATLAAEAEQAGLSNLGASPVGSGVYLGRRRVGSMAELRNVRIWVWDAERLQVALLREMGLQIVPSPVDRAGRELEAGHTDGFWAVPTAILAFQWWTQASFLIDLRSEYLFGCLLVANRVFSGIAPEDQRQIRAASAQLADRFDEVSRQQERALLSGTFQHQGVTVIEPSEKFRAEFFAAATAARDRIGPKLVPKELIQRVLGLLADYRGEHGGKR